MFGKQLYPLLFFCVASPILICTKAQMVNDNFGHFAQFVNPNFFAFDNLYCGQIHFIPTILQLNEKKKVVLYSKDAIPSSKPLKFFSELYIDAKSILDEVAHAKNSPCTFGYCIYKGYKNTPETDFTISVSSGSSSVRKDHASSDNELLFSFFSNANNDITHIESFESNYFPGIQFSGIINDSIIVIGNDTISTAQFSSDLQVFTCDKKKRPVCMWIYDDMNRLRQYREYTYSEFGVLKIDSTNINWEGNKVRKIMYKNCFSIFYYDDNNNISSIENFKGSVMLNTFNFYYKFDLKGNWVSYELQEYDPKKNEQYRKYFVIRTIAYRN